MAEQTVIAIGRNIFPSRPSRVKIGQVDRDDDEHAEEDRPRHLDGGAREERRRWLAGSATKSGSPVGSCSARRRMKFSIMTTAPSTIRPKSIAPSDIRFADTPKSRMPMKPASIERGMTAATMSDGPHVAQEEEEDGDDEERAFEQVLRDRVRGAVDDLALVVEGRDRACPPGSVFCDLRDPRPSPGSPTSLAVLALEHDDHAGHRLALAVAGHRALPRHGADAHVGHVADEDRARRRPRRHDAPRGRRRPVARPMPRTVKRSERCSMKPPLKEALLSATASTTWCSDEAVALELRAGRRPRGTAA